MEARKLGGLKALRLEGIIELVAGHRILDSDYIIDFLLQPQYFDDIFQTWRQVGHSLVEFFQLKQLIRRTFKLTTFLSLRRAAYNFECSFFRAD